MSSSPSLIVTRGFWTQTCICSLIRNPPRAEGCEVSVVVVDNSPWSPAICGVELLKPLAFDAGMDLWVAPNLKTNKFHASALDSVVDLYQFDHLMALETDVLALRPTWLQWFMDLLRPTDYAVGMWHHEQFVNPSCTLYRGEVLHQMRTWCKNHPDPDSLRWGPNFTATAPLDNNLPLTENPASALQNIKDWIAGPFAEKRGWPAGTTLKEQPSGQTKGPGWYEPGQQLHHWAVESGYTYTIAPTSTFKRHDNLPLQTLYGGWGHDEPLTYPTSARMAQAHYLHNHGRPLEAVELFGNAETAHLWGGTRALDILKHPVTCNFVKANTPMWLAREARFWKQVVPPDIQTATLSLIRQHSWHITGQGSPFVSDRDREAAEYVRSCYREGGVEW